MSVMGFTNLIKVDVLTFKDTGTEKRSSALILRDLIRTWQESMATMSLKGTLFEEKQLLLGSQFCRMSFLIGALEALTKGNPTVTYFMQT